jgi:hypothetical protein
MDPLFIILYTALALTVGMALQWSGFLTWAAKKLPWSRH